MILGAGDGTLLSTTHFINGNANKVIGFNFGEMSNIMNQGSTSNDELVEKILNYKSYKIETYDRLLGKVVTATGRNYEIDLAFNEYAIGNNLYGRPSKFTISTNGSESFYPPHWNSNKLIRSSGLVVSTLQGMTGWIKNIIKNEPKFNYLVKVFEANPNKMFFMTREIMDENEEIAGFVDDLEVNIDMVGGLISLDGFTEFPVSRGDKVTIQKSNKQIQILKVLK